MMELRKALDFFMPSFFTLKKGTLVDG